MAINLASKYSPIVAERFSKESVTDILMNTDYDWNGVKTVNVYSVDTVPLTNYTRSGTNRYGTPDDLPDTTQSLTLTQDKAFTYIVDKGDNQEQMNIKQAATTLARQVREVIVPAIDTYRLGVMSAAATAATQVITDAPTKDNIIELLGKANVFLDNGLVPTLGRTMWISSSAANLVTMNTQFQRKGDMANPVVINGLLGSILEATVIKVPDNYLPAGTSAIIGYGNAMTAPVTLSELKAHVDAPGISGVLCEGRIIHDAFVLDARAKGFAMLQTI